MNKTPIEIYRAIFILFCASILFCSCENYTISGEKEEIGFKMISYNPVEYFSFKQKVEEKKAPKSPYSCVVSTLTAKGSKNKYVYNSYWIQYPDSLSNKFNGNTTKKTYVLGSDYAKGRAHNFKGYKEVVRVAKCTLPQNEKAIQLVETSIRNFDAKSWIVDKKAKNNINSTISSCSEVFITIVCVPTQQKVYDCEITSIECVAYDGGGSSGGIDGGGDDGGDSPEPCQNRSDPNCGPTGGGGGSTTPPPNPCEESDPPAYCNDPCQTGIPIVDSITNQIVFEQLWEYSNVDDAILSNRSEQGGFITEESDGTYGFTPFPSDWQYAACSISPPSDWINDLPQNTVAYVHTHPFFTGEDTRPVCGSDGDESYTSGASQEDYETLVAMANQLSNYNIKGIVIDGGGITVFDALQNINTENRCGY